MGFQDQNQQDVFRSNPNLKSPLYKEYVTPEIIQERIAEIKHIFADIDYFARKYFYIISLDKGKCLIEPYEKQSELLRSFTKYKRNIILASRQIGKCLTEDSIIKIRNKKTGEIEELPIKQFFERIKKENE